MSNTTEIWYTKGQFCFFSVDIMDHGMELDETGRNYTEEKIAIPTNETLSKTHTIIATGSEYHGSDINEMDLNELFNHFQGHNWSPNGEARDFIKRSETRHTSISVGDVIAKDDKIYMVMGEGFKELK